MTERAVSATGTTASHVEGGHPDPASLARELYRVRASDPLTPEDIEDLRDRAIIHKVLASPSESPRVSLEEARRDLGF